MRIFIFLFLFVQLTPFWSSSWLLSLVSLCCLRLVWSCALCSLMCCRLRYTSALTCWLCMESLANMSASLLSPLCLPCLSAAWVSLTVRQKHTFRDANSAQKYNTSTYSPRFETIMLWFAGVAWSCPWINTFIQQKSREAAGNSYQYSRMFLTDFGWHKIPHTCSDTQTNQPRISIVLDSV